MRKLVIVFLFFATFTAGVVSTELFHFSTAAYAQKVLTYKVVFNESINRPNENDAAKVEVALSAYAKQGWKLHSIAGAFMILER
jgi:hypothetical protein